MEQAAPGFTQGDRERISTGKTRPRIVKRRAVHDNLRAFGRRVATTAVLVQVWRIVKDSIGRPNYHETVTIGIQRNSQSWREMFPCARRHGEAVGNPTLTLEIDTGWSVRVYGALDALVEPLPAVKRAFSAAVVWREKGLKPQSGVHRKAGGCLPGVLQIGSTKKVESTMGHVQNEMAGTVSNRYLFRKLFDQAARLQSVLAVLVSVFSIYLLATVPMHPAYSSQVITPLIGLIIGLSLALSGSIVKINKAVIDINKRLTDLEKKILERDRE